MSNAIDLSGFPIIRMDQISQVDTNLLIQSGNEIQELIVSLVTDKEIPPLVFYLRKQSEAMKSELAKRSAAERVNLLLSGALDVLNMKVDYENDSLSNSVIMEQTDDSIMKSRSAPSSQPSATLNTNKPLISFSDRSNRFKPIPLPSELAVSNLKSSSTKSLPNIEWKTNINETNTKNTKIDNHSDSNSNNSNLNSDYDADESDSQPSVSNESGIGYRGSSRRPSSSDSGKTNTNIKSDATKSVSKLPPRKSNVVVNKNFSSEFIVAATEKKVRFYPKKKPDETPEDIKIREQLERRKGAMQRLLDRRESRQQFIMKQKAERRKKKSQANSKSIVSDNSSNSTPVSIIKTEEDNQQSSDTESVSGGDDEVSIHIEDKVIEAVVKAQVENSKTSQINTFDTVEEDEQKNSNTLTNDNITPEEDLEYHVENNTAIDLSVLSPPLVTPRDIMVDQISNNIHNSSKQFTILSDIQSQFNDKNMTTNLSDNNSNNQREENNPSVFADSDQYQHILDEPTTLTITVTADLSSVNNKEVNNVDEDTLILDDKNDHNALVDHYIRRFSSGDFNDMDQMNNINNNNDKNNNNDNPIVQSITKSKSVSIKIDDLAYLNNQSNPLIDNDTDINISNDEHVELPAVLSDEVALKNNAAFQSFKAMKLVKSASRSLDNNDNSVTVDNNVKNNIMRVESKTSFKNSVNISTSSDIDNILRDLQLGDGKDKNELVVIESIPLIEALQLPINDDSYQEGNKVTSDDLSKICDNKKESPRCSSIISSINDYVTPRGGQNSILINRVEDGAYECITDPDSLPGLKSWILRSFVKQVAVWDVDSSLYEKVLKRDAIADKLFHQRKKLRRMITFGLVMLAVDCEELLLGKIPIKDSTHFLELWEQNLKQFDEKAFNLSKHNPELLFNEPFIPKIIPASPMKINSLVDIYPHFNSIFPIGLGADNKSTDKTIARLFVESMHFQCRVYDEWIEVMSDYSTVFSEERKVNEYHTMDSGKQNDYQHGNEA
eukprot:gene12935-17342_t